MAYQTIGLDHHDRTAVIRLNRPERMNAVIEEMYREIQDALGRCLEGGEVRCVVLTGSVLRRDGKDKQAFCAGADLKKHSSGERTPADRRRYIELAHETARRLFHLPLPTIAAVNGPARGAGFELALACDLMLVAEEATLALPETGLGTYVGGGVTHILPRLVGLARAKELIFTGRVVGGRETVDMGLALRCVPVERLLDEALSLAAVVARGAPAPTALAKRHLNGALGRDLEEALDLETEAILACMETEDWHEGLRAVAEKRPPRFTGR